MPGEKGPQRPLLGGEFKTARDPLRTLPHLAKLGPVTRSASKMFQAVTAAIERRPEHMQILRHVAALGLADGWVGAGFVRNAIWDDLHRYDDLTPLADVDVVYFDTRDTSPEHDEHYEAMLFAAAPSVPWSVKNQARMHVRNGDAPYLSTADALMRWPETCTAVAARLELGAVQVLAPLGLHDLFDLVVRPTPHFETKLRIYRSRVAAKDWTERWPGLRIDQIGPS